MVGIYKITNPIGLVYIGKSIDIHKRFISHRCGGAYRETKLLLSYQEYGFENHKFEIIYICGESVLPVFESFFIDKYNSIIIGLNSANAKTDYSHLEFDPIEISEPYYVKNIQEDPTRGAGAKEKFEGIETELLHVRKIVPLGMAKVLKQEINERIKNL